MKSFASEMYCRIMVYEKPTAILAWLLGGEAFRELLLGREGYAARGSVVGSLGLLAELMETRQPDLGQHQTQRVRHLLRQRQRLLTLRQCLVGIPAQPQHQGPLSSGQ